MSQFVSSGLGVFTQTKPTPDLKVDFLFLWIFRVNFADKIFSYDGMVNFVFLRVKII